MSSAQIILTDRLFDGASVREHAYVVYQHGTITDVGARADLGERISERFAQPIVLPPDATLLPGLINMHTHLSFSAAPTVFDDARSESDALKMIRIVENMHAALAVGITTVRDCGTWPHLALPARDAVMRGLLPGPRIIASGAVTTTGGHCWYCATEADSEDEVRKAVRAHVKDGVDFIKLFATGGNTTPGSDALICQYTEAQLCAASEEARKAGRRTAVHAHAEEGVRRSIAAAVTTIEHCSLQNEHGIGWNEQMVGDIAAKGIYVCPTVFRGVTQYFNDPSYQPDARAEQFAKRLQQRLQLTRRLADHGVRLICGNDAGVSHCHIRDYPGDLVLMAQGSGLAPAQVLKSATSVAAAALGRGDIGTVAAGKAADLLAVQGNPLDDIKNIHRTTMVIAAGKTITLKTSSPKTSSPKT